MSISRNIYTVLLYLLLPYAWFHLFWRGRKQPEYRQHVGERFGFYALNSAKPVIWLHTVSVGETRAAASLVERLLSAYPQYQILLTHTTPTGRASSEQLYQNKVLRVYLPYDFPFAVQRFLAHFQPSVGILLETEIWPNLIHACQQRQTPLLLLNARLSEKSFKRYARFPSLSQQALRQLSMVAAQTEADAARLRSLGASNLVVMGNLKYDIQPPADLLERGVALRELFGKQRPILLAASTREGEEELILAALQRCQAAKFLLVMVPRHPQRFLQVSDLIKKFGFSMQSRSDNQFVDENTQVLLGDSMGELFAYYVACDVAFIGGSLLPFGGQNLIEACAVGKPVLLGEHTYNFAQVSEMALQSQAALQVATADELLKTASELLNHPAQRQQMGAAGLQFVKLNQGATQQALQLVRQHLM